ncbi:MAG: hypothetical protein JWO10_815 [Microbacteriaceae bacterium]|nr:hypothetical protein [Microbacteriaceae bacterium]
MVNRLWTGAQDAVTWITAGYRPSARPLAVVRMLFALDVLFLPYDISWIPTMPAQAWYPPPGPFELFTSLPSPGFILGLEIVRAVVALWLLLGWSTLAASIAMTVVSLLCHGLCWSFGNIHHLILYDLAPLALGIVGWGAAWSIDSLRKRNRPPTAPAGYPMFLFAIVIAFAMFTAAIPKLLSGWLDPAREATHSYVTRDLVLQTGPGPLTEWALQIDSPVFWKFLDYVTLFGEGTLIILMFFPGLFRLGLLLISAFHIGVWLLLGIDFSEQVFVYAGFFCLSFSGWFPELGLIRRWRGARSHPPPLARVSAG